MTKEIKIQTPEEYFTALEEYEHGSVNDEQDKITAKALHSYLIGLSPMGRQQIAVYSPSRELRDRHGDWVDSIERSPAHNDFMRRLARIGGGRRPKTNEELITDAAVGAVILQKHRHAYDESIKVKGKFVQCQLCAGYFHSSETERIKPYASTRYLRFCSKCAEKVKMAKVVYQRTKKDSSK